LVWPRETEKERERERERERDRETERERERERETDLWLSSRGDINVSTGFLAIQLAGREDLDGLAMGASVTEMNWDKCAT
jgi:hypothetical protein